MEKMIKKVTLNKYLLHILAFVIPALIIIAVLKYLGFYPFGNKSLFIMDMQDQYLHFFASLKELVSQESSLFFSWSKALGQNYIGLYAYYLASPLSLITLFFDKEALPLGIVMLTIIKISLCGITLSVYLDKVFHDNKLSKLFFTTCYALMSYNLVYSLSLMWLDAVILLPIILWGIENIIRKGKTSIFIISLGLIFISNYYIAFSVSLFCVLYYFFRWFSLNGINNIKVLLKNFLKISIAAVAGIGLSAWLVVPAIVDLGTRGASGRSTELLHDSFYLIIKKFLPCSYDSITDWGKPSIYCGFIIIILVGIYFFNKKIELKLRLLSGGIFMVLFMSFWIVPLDELWHGMQKPNWFPYRYAYLFSFFMILTAYTQFSHMKKINEKYIVPIGSLCFIAIACVDMFFNSVGMIKGLDNEFGYHKIDNYTVYYNETKQILDEIKADKNDLYRIEKDFQYSNNDAMLFGYNGISHYSSTYNKNVNKFVRDVGMSQPHFINSYIGSTPITDSIFGVKYIMSKTPHNALHQEINKYDDVILYKNKNYLPFGFALQSDGNQLVVMTENPFQNQNIFLNSLTGMEGAVFQVLEFSNAIENEGKTVIYNFIAKENEPAYLYMHNGIKEAKIFVNGVFLCNYLGRDISAALYLGTFPADNQVVIRIESLSSDSLEIYDTYISYMDTSYFEASIEALKKEGFYETSKVKNGLNAKINVSKEKMCFTSIPYQKGFTVKINGVKADYFSYADTFLAFYVPEGENDVEIRFVSPGFYIGLIITLITLIALIGKMFYRQIRNLRH